jgi:expansin (peptidoglycan-binding protein)
VSAFTNQTEDDVLDLLFTNVDAPNWGDAAGLQNSATAGSLHVSAHENDALSDTSTLQTDNEAGYTGYGRIAIARSAAGWTVNAGTVDNDALGQFGEATAGTPETITDVGIGFALSGAGYLHIHGQVAQDLVVNNGVNPQIAAGALDVSIN